METQNAELVDCGVDWITLTFADQKNAELALTKAAGLMMSESQTGNDKAIWNLYGYEGFSCGGIRFGSRSQDALVMLSGPLAHQKWDRFFRLASNVSRLDLQTTIRYSTSSTSKIASHYKSACRAHKRKAARRRVTLLRSTDGSATIYLGSRQSDAFGRVYQKDAESKLQHYQNAVRYEVELKGKAGISAISTIARTTDPAPHIFSQVRGWFADSSIFYPNLQHAQTALKCIPRTRGDDSRRLTWIESDVRPAVKTLLEHGRLQCLIHALGLSEYVQPIAIPDRQNLAHEESWIQ